MSTAADVVARTTTLLERLEALVESTREVDLPTVAAGLGVAQTAESLTQGLVDVLQLVREELQVVAALGQLGALFGLVEPLIGGLHGIVDGAGQAVAELGFGHALPIDDAISTGFRHLQDAVALGSSLMLAPAQLENLRHGMDDVIEALEELADDFAAA